MIHRIDFTLREPQRLKIRSAWAEKDGRAYAASEALAIYRSELAPDYSEPADQEALDIGILAGRCRTVESFMSEFETLMTAKLQERFQPVS